MSTGWQRQMENWRSDYQVNWDTVLQSYNRVQYDNSVMLIMLMLIMHGGEKNAWAQTDSVINSVKTILFYFSHKVKL